MSKPLTEQQLLVGKRRKARHYAMQALYQWKMSGSSLNKIDTEFRTDNDFSKVDGEYFGELLHKVPSTCGTLDTMIENGLTDRTLDEINPVELALLRMSAYELQARLDVPYKVVINEAVSLGKKFGATDSHKFINAVLDKVAVQCRGPEVQAGEQ
ncbi:Transcription antitermination protein NusB [BD1-7 clade bacterium]|uniref:Transcription antitermination protein NusB n=1 Tax=BD1-7 clade bacterium TaxID=2029982 RepID=A0A5S9MZ74_9GAMM|nr:Transcription antitermination protein NusB [BD1-7 clade bacterium]CAA0082711.1 Transcription antitermination protein NusB [BD1-7 clade bacterium]